VSEQEELLAQAKAKRDLAKQALRLSRGLSEPDRAPLLRLAEEAERQASELEKKASMKNRTTSIPPQLVVQQQAQVQQAEQTPPTENEPKTPKPSE
jgi:hypothetical protein